MKIIDFFKKIFKCKPKEKPIIYTEEDLEQYKGKTITEDDVDKIIDIVNSYDKYIQEYLSDDYSEFGKFLKRTTFKEAILQRAYLNFSNTLKSDYYGEHHYHSAYLRCCKENNEDPHAIGSAYFELKMVRIHTIGWDLSEKLDLKCENDINLNYNNEL